MTEPARITDTRQAIFERSMIDPVAHAILEILRQVERRAHGLDDDVDREGLALDGAATIMKLISPVRITNRTRITLPEVPGVVFIESGLHTMAAPMAAELHLVEENEWHARRVANGLATPGAATAE